MTQPAQQVAIVLTTFAVGQAMAVARTLVEERLAACECVAGDGLGLSLAGREVQQEAESRW
jgi:uncharacterized protein involved in tolerance to divalent cations